MLDSNIREMNECRNQYQLAGYVPIEFHPQLNRARPTLRLKDVLKITSVSRSKAYELMKTDSDFPKGVPLYDGVNSPKFYWEHEAVAWVMKREALYQTKKNGVKA